MILNIRLERKRRKWTQEYVATQIGITQTTLQKIETGRCKPSYEVLVKLENLFKKSHRQLFAVADDTDQSQKNNTIKNE